MQKLVTKQNALLAILLPSEWLFHLSSILFWVDVMVEIIAVYFILDENTEGANWRS